MKYGIYLITCRSNDRVYVGSAHAVSARWKRHIRDLNAHRHYNPILQAAWDKYGEAAFEFSIIETCDPETLLERETYWIDRHRSAGRVFNIAEHALAPMTGRSHPHDVRQKIALGNTGKLHTDESKERIRLAKLGTPGHPNQRAAVSESNKSRAVKDGTREKLRRLKTGLTHSPETRAKMAEISAARWKNEEFVERMKKALTGRKLTEEHKANISKGGKGIKKSPETIQRMREAAKRRDPSIYKKVGDALRGRPKSNEQRAKQSATMKAKYAAKRAEKEALEKEMVI
ncbi:MAG: GIY-YIG nuclease family protein [Pusillimonas sp.]